MTGEFEGPDFLCVGLPKAGTAWLYDQVEVHRDFWMPPVKELHYFDNAMRNDIFARLYRRLVERPDGLAAANENRAQRNLIPFDARDVQFMKKAMALQGQFDDLDGYADLFTPKGDKISGDITPAYSIISEEVIQRIDARFPNIKVILMVRDPIDRAWSQVNMWMRRYREGATPTEWDAVNARMQQGGFLQRSFPTEVWRRWRAHVPEERFLLVFLDEVSEHPASARGAVLKFLGADVSSAPDQREADFNRKSGKPKTPMSEEIRARMVELFGEEVLACAKLFGGPATGWPARYGL